MRSTRAIAPLLLLGALVAACAGGTAPSGSAASPDASAGPSTAPDASAGQVEVVTTDYAFSDFGASLQGPVTFTMRNDGAELHEMVIVRKNDGVTTTFEELLALPEDEAFAQVQFVGQTMAEGGQTAPDALTATDPGEYLMVCFIPQGMTTLPSLDPNASGPPDLGDGPPHFTLGMLREFSITE